MILNRYKNLIEIGSGRYSSIYKAFDSKANRYVAIKKIYKNYFDEPDYALKCAKKEIEITKICQSENVVKFYENYETNENIILVLELCDSTLEGYIQEDGPKQDFKNFYFFQQFLLKLNNALKMIHKKKVIHRDIKPENIFIKIENGELIPKLGDFGISTFYLDKKDYKVNYEGDDQRHTSSVGTYYYIAPEILKSEPYNHLCDLFSLGVSLYILIFGTTPYGPLGLGVGRFEKVERIINEEKELHLIKSGIPSLDDLFEKLLKIEPENRITFEDYFNHKFFNEEKNFLMNTKNQFIYPKEEKSKKPIFTEEMKKMNKVKSIAKSFIDIMDLPNIYINGSKIQNQKISNIIYYDENIEKHLEDIHNDCDIFENVTTGAFLLCTNLNALKFTMVDIKESNIKDHRVIFNLIVTGSKFEKVMNYLNSISCEKYIHSICIYCMKIDKYSHFSKKYPKIRGIYDNPQNVIKFIQDHSFTGIQPFSHTKVLTFHDYKYKYFQRHQKISQFYGDFTEETYNKAKDKFKNFISNENQKDLKKDKQEIEKSFKTFNLDKDLESLDKLLIIEYTKNTLYGDLNNWLRSLKNDVYEKISYYTARLMYSLNNYGFNQNKFYKKNLYLFRGAKTKYTNILPYERAIGKVIIISNFTSTSENEYLAKNWSGRSNSKSIYNQNKKFSCLYKIKNNINMNSIPFGINIQQISEYQKEEEILFQPFSFYRVKNVQFDYDNFTVDIELQTIIKNEILESKIQKGKQVNYDQFKDLVYIENN